MLVRCSSQHDRNTRDKKVKRLREKIEKSKERVKKHEDEGTGSDVMLLEAGL